MLDRVPCRAPPATGWSDRPVRWLFVVLGTLVLIAGCSREAPVPAPAAPSAAAAPVVVGFGTPLRLPDGVGVLLGAPRVYVPARRPGPSAPDRLLQLPVTVIDASPAAYPIARTSVLVTFDGRPGTPIPLDEPPEIVAPGSTTLLPGQTGSFDLLFRVPPAGTDVVAAVTDQPGSTPVFVRGPSPAPPATTTTPPPSKTPTSSTAPTTTRSSSSGDTGAGCGPRAAARGAFNPGCPEYQGYLDPGRAAGRGPTSGDIQHAYGCKQGYIPASEC